MDDKEKLDIEAKVNDEDAKAEVSGNVPNPILLLTVIHRIIEFLSLKDIKNCRYICSHWNEAVEPILRIRSAIKYFKEVYFGQDLTRFCPSKFFEVFPSTPNTIAFTAFKISSNHGSRWSVGVLNDFFWKYQKNIQQLKIYNLYLATENGQDLKSVDITPWIINSHMTKAESKSKSILKVLNDFQYLEPHVQNSVLANVKKISLKNCSIHLQDPIKLHPVYLELNNVSFLKDNVLVPLLCINDFVDMSKMNYLYLDMEGEWNCTSFIVNLVGELDIKSVELWEGVTVTNWANCKWNVEDFRSCLPFLEKTEMQIQKLYLWKSVVDLSMLPISLKKLTLNMCTFLVPISTTETTTMDTLSHLELQLSDEKWFSIFFKCLKCPNLVDLYLRGNMNGKYKNINSVMIPRSVKTLKLSNDVTIKWIDGDTTNLNLDQLDFTNYNFKDFNKMSQLAVQAKEIIVSCSEGAEVAENIIHLLLYLNLRDPEQYLQRIYVGPFNWENKSFELSPLFKYVDKKAEYYVFEKQLLGKALQIGAEEFQKFENHYEWSI